MAVKKSELYSMLWSSCDQLRGGMDASQYKDYVLVMLFLKYISDKKKNLGDDYLMEIPEGCSFEDFVTLKGNKNIGEEMNKKLQKIAEANDLSGVIDVADFNDPTKLGSGDDKVKTLSNLINVFQNSGLDFGKNRQSDDDLMGDAYEYLMKNFATQSGKSKGQFYTPAEVSRVIAKVIGLSNENKNVTIYDPTCGSGSLLLRALAETRDGKGASLYGQEMDSSTAGLAKMNMFLHGYEIAEIKQGDTLNNPQFVEGSQLKDFDYVVANPPFSQKSWLKSAKTEDTYKRWGEGIGIGVPPESVGDYAFLLHIVKSLNWKGQGACILPHGVLFRGGAEQKIRTALLTKQKCIKGIIGLPSNLFFGTGIPACIIILDKKDAQNRKGIFMIDAKDGYKKDGAKNRLREQDIKRIVDTWNAQKDVAHYARFVSMEEIEKNEYNLNIPRYIEAKDTEIIQDIEAHLHGGIPKHDIEQLQDYWDMCPSLKDDLFETYPGHDGYFKLKCEPEQIREVIHRNADFQKQEERFKKAFEYWGKDMRGHIMCNLPNGHMKPKLLFEKISEEFLLQFKGSETLVDGYDAYDVLLNYWTETMQDDFYMVSADGWKAELKFIYTGKKVKTAPTSLSELQCDLLPVSIVLHKFFEDDEVAIEGWSEHLQEEESDLADMLEEHGGEDGYLSEGNLGEKWNDASVKKRVKVLDKRKDAEELEVLNKYLATKELISDCKKGLKDADQKAALHVWGKYPELQEDEVAMLVIDDKWFASIQKGLDAEMQKVGQTLMAEVTEMAERYSQTLGEINSCISDLEKSVNNYLNVMGFNL